MFIHKSPNPDLKDSILFVRLSVISVQYTFNSDLITGSEAVRLITIETKTDRVSVGFSSTDDKLLREELPRKLKEL